MAASGSLALGSLPFEMGELRIPGDRFPLNGVLDEVNFWNIALFQAQIQASLSNGFTAPQAGLVAYYKMNQGIAAGNNTAITTILDSSGNYRHGTINNMTMMGATSNLVQSGTFYGTIHAGIAITENSGTPNDGMVAAGTPVNLTASGGTNYLWSTGATESATRSTAPSNL